MTDDEHNSPGVFSALLIPAVLGICLFTGIAALGLVGPDEPRYAWIARAVALTGNWITPKLWGKPWFEKPVLYYWAGAVGFKFLRSPEWAARLPSAISAFIAALATGWLALRQYGTKAAAATLLIFPTCVGVIAFARAAAPDMLFTAALALALVSAFRVVEKRGSFSRVPRPEIQRDHFDLILLGIWLGFAVLAKGPAGIILAGGSAFLWAAVTSNWKVALRMLHPLAILAFAVVALPWYVLCARANPSFFQIFIIENNFERYLTPMFHHPQPFWFFGKVVVLGTLPWTALLVGAAFDARRIFRDGSWRNSAGLFIACWIIFPTAFFSFSKSKLPEYILPIFPALALIMAHSFTRAMEHAQRKAQWMGIGTGVMWVALGVGGAIGFHRLPMYAPLTEEQVAALAMTSLITGAAIGALIESLSLWRKLWLVIAFSALASACLLIAAEAGVLPKLDPVLSPRTMAQEISAIAPATKVYSLGKVSRNCTYGLQFYLQRNSLPQYDFKNPASGYVLMTWGGDARMNDNDVVNRKVVARFLPYCWIEFVQPKK